jgi:hypothetical protein
MREQADDNEITVNEFVAVQLMYCLYTVYRLRRKKTPILYGLQANAPQRKLISVQLMKHLKTPASHDARKVRSTVW